MNAVSSFPPIAGDRATVLILGSMPGVASLDAHRYYAHPRNAFWPIVLAWLDGSAADPHACAALEYEERVARLQRAGVAVWDVLASCERPGSLDSAIVAGSERANAIGAFAARHPELQRIVFNGRTARTLYDRHVARGQRALAPSLHDAPSTSPAMASLTLQQKQTRWHAALGPRPLAHGAAIGAGTPTSSFQDQ